MKCDIAIVGMACQFPGASDLTEFWRLISQGNSSEKIEYLDSGEVSSCYPLEGIDKFDPEFFGFSHAEAVSLDPQFRKFFETSWHAIESAGLARSLESHNIGVFATSGMTLHKSKALEAFHEEYFKKDLVRYSAIDDFTAKVSALPEYMPLMLSYRLGLTGPSLYLHSACSSGLSATHSGIQSLLLGESDYALVGGSSLIYPVNSGYFYEEGSVFSKQGKCIPFSNLSDGVVGGSGSGAVVLTTVEKAKEHSHRVFARIRSTSINNDGKRKVSFTAPSIQGQSQNIRSCLEEARVGGIGLIEAHGTGTAMGDPIEFQSLLEGANGLKNRFSSDVVVSSVKSNIGHLDATSGIASIIKAALCVYYGVKPGIAGFGNINPMIEDFEGPNFRFESQSSPWNEKLEERGVLVASLGAGGTNCHLIMEGDTHQSSGRLTEIDHGPLLFLFSGESKASALESAKSKLSYGLEYKVDSYGMASYLISFQKFLKFNILILASDVAEANDKLKKGQFSLIKLKGRKKLEKPIQLLSGKESEADLQNLLFRISENPMRLFSLKYEYLVEYPYDLPGYSFDLRKFWPDTKKINSVSCSDIDVYSYKEEIVDFDKNSSKTVSWVHIQSDRFSEAINFSDLEVDSWMFYSPVSSSGFNLQKELVLFNQFLSLLLKSNLSVNQINIVILGNSDIGRPIFSSLKSACQEVSELSPYFVETDNSNLLNKDLFSNIVNTFQSIDERHLKLNAQKNLSKISMGKSLDAGPLKTKRSVAECSILLGSNSEIGHKLIETLVGVKNVKKFIFVARSEPSTKLSKLLSSSVFSGCSYRWVQGDVCAVSTWEDLQKSIAEISPDSVDVFHLAGIKDDKRFSLVDSKSLNSVIAPKLSTLKNSIGYLEKPMRHILFSSLSSTFGVPGQFSYSAANAVFDAYASDPENDAFSFQWGPWGDVGMASQLSEIGEKYRSMGLIPFSSEPAIEAMFHVLESHKPGCYGVGQFDISNMVEINLDCFEPFLLGKQIFGNNSVETKIDFSRGTDVKSLTRGEVKKRVFKEVESIVGQKLNSSLSVESFDSLGIDSIKLIALSEKLKGHFSEIKGPTFFYSNNSIDEVIEALSTKNRSLISDETNEMKLRKQLLDEFFD